MKRAGKVIALAVAALPVFVIAQCVYSEASQRSGLESLCASAANGSAVSGFQDRAAKPPFKVRAGGRAGKNESEWFDREYLRLGEYLRKTRNTTDDYTVAFAKPGIGYYACIVTHKDGVVRSAWFEDRSS